MREYPYRHEKGKLPPTLAKVEFLANVDQAALDGILSHSSLVEFDGGEDILKEGEISTEFYILLKGEVEVKKGGESVATLAQSGEILGELRSLTGEARTATVSAATHCFLLKVKQNFIDGLSESERSAYYIVLYRFLAEVLAKRLEETSARLAALEKDL